MNNDYYIDIDKLWDNAEEKGFFTIKSLELGAGVYKGSVKRIEIGDFNIGTLIKIADALDVEPRDLLIKPIKEEDE